MSSTVLPYTRCIALFRFCIYLPSGDEEATLSNAYKIDMLGGLPGFMRSTSSPNTRFMCKGHSETKTCVADNSQPATFSLEDSNSATAIFATSCARSGLINALPTSPMVAMARKICTRLRKVLDLAVAEPEDTLPDRKAKAALKEGVALELEEAIMRREAREEVRTSSSLSMEASRSCAMACPMFMV